MIQTCTFIIGYFFVAGVGATITRAPRSQGVSVGGSILLSCGTSAATVTWTGPGGTPIFNGAKLSTGTKFQMNPSSPYDLTATNVDSSFCGTYTCTDTSGSSASADVLVFSTPQCQGVRSDSNTSAVCNVSNCVNSNDVQLNLQQNGQNIATGDSNIVFWTSSTTNPNTNGITCNVASFPGVNSSCTFTNAGSSSSRYPLRSIPANQADIALSSVLASASIIGMSFAIYFFTCGTDNAHISPFSVVYQVIYFLVPLGILISTAVATSLFVGSSTSTSTGSVNNNLIYQNTIWLTAVLVISAIIVLVQCALLPTTVYFVYKEVTSTTTILLLSSAVLNLVGSIIILSWSVVIGNIFIDNGALDPTTWTWQIFLIVFLVTLLIQTIVCVVRIIANIGPKVYAS